MKLYATFSNCLHIQKHIVINILHTSKLWDEKETNQ